MPTSPPLLGQALPVELMNTVFADRHGVHDALTSVESARRWLAALAPRLDAPLAGSAGRLTEDGLARLRRLRDALRRLAAELTDDPRAPAASAIGELETAVRTVNEHVGSARATPILELAEGGGVIEDFRVTGPPGELFASAMAAEAVHFFGRWRDLELRACLAPGCVLYFIKNHPRREWCSTACGNRARAARHYARHGKPPSTG
ncbi:CGNR zinc finger domain-containing protein [Actinomadura decatromicini]|uniref:CGNR zinc finger domain-containing protein n=1 Tax=Actinomadura decatromicini TaxID=2604572 RepID=A0A5D3FRW7_9ACTN|nr:CGNR zinc finger domain-containing protein [Actinomadura decatromicini]TYK50993.1 CGNR zinc finger domain-containing protein [Actinomadura decatromicini]